MTDRDQTPYPLERLTQMQRYLGEEMIEEYQAGQLTRRQLLRRLLGICGSGAAVAALLIACGDQTATAPQATGEAPATPPGDATSGAATAPAARVEPTVGTTATAEPAAETTAEATAAAESTVETTATAEPAAETTSEATAAPDPQPTSSSPLSVRRNDPDISWTDVTLQSDTTVLGYLARPKAEGTYPGVIVIHENRGLNSHIRDVARRLAKAGYVALAPDLASRAGGTERVGRENITAHFANANPEELVRDLNAAATFLGQQPGVLAGKLGVVGFCMGGTYTLRLAAANPAVAAAVCYYGVTPEPASQMAATNAAILGQYGGNDARVNATIPALEQVMRDNGKTFEKRIYEGAGHAFNNDTGRNYNEAAALAAWQATLTWFGTYLKGESG